MITSVNRALTDYVERRFILLQVNPDLGASLHIVIKS